MAHFVQLLNEKKLKIRNQQRLLASATADAAKGRTEIFRRQTTGNRLKLTIVLPVLEIQAATSKLHEAAEPHQAVKRRARDVGDTDEDSDEGFEQMDVDQQRTGEDSLRDQDTDDGGQSTPQPLEEDVYSATDNEHDESMEAVPPAARLEQAASSKRSSPRKETAPPRRVLPFTRRGPSSTRDSRPEPREDAEETAGETDDDEL